MILKESVREEVWRRLDCVSYQIQDLRGIVQNEMELKQEEYYQLLGEWKGIKDTIDKELSGIISLLFEEIKNAE